MLLVDDLAAGGTKNLRHTPRGLVTLIHVYLDCGIPFFLHCIYRKSTFSENFLFEELIETLKITGNDQSSDQLDTRVLYQPQG